MIDENALDAAIQAVRDRDISTLDLAVRVGIEAYLSMPPTPSSPVSSPSPAGGVREALRRAADEGYRVCAETRHVTPGDKVREATLALSSPATGEG